jgi:hypothetical protein
MKNSVKIEQILVVPATKYKAIMPADELKVVLMEYETSIKYNPNTSQWVSSVIPTPSEWNVTHLAKGKRSNRKLVNYYELKKQQPNLFDSNRALVAGGVSLVGTTLVLSGQTPADIINSYITGEIPTKNGRKYIK